MSLLQDRIAALVEQHGSYRDAGEAIGVDHAYLYRLKMGDSINPSDRVLYSLGLRSLVVYVDINDQF